MAKINLFGNGMIGYVNKENTTDERFYFVKDHLGSVRLTLNGSGIESGKDYYSYGSILRNVNYGEAERYDFTEKERDAETGLNYFGARYYDSEGSFWYSVDPLADKRPGLSPYNYCQNNPLNRFDPDGREDWWAFTKAVGKTLLSGYFIGASTLGMAGTSMATIGTAGISGPVTIPGFLGNFAVFTASTISFTEGIADGITALQTPDGMKAESLSIIKSTVEGLGGDATTQAIAKTIFDTIGMKGIENIGREGIVQTIGIIMSGENVAEDVIEILNAMVEKEKNERKENNDENNR